MRAKSFLLWFAWGYVLFVALWLILRLLFFDRLWWLVLFDFAAIYLFVPLLLLLAASLWKHRWRLLAGASIPIVTFVLVYGTLFLPRSVDSQPSIADTLLVCGWDEVFALKLKSEDEKPVKVWSWRAASSAGLPALMVAKFATTDECKPIEQGRKVLITSSTDGVALVEQETGKTLFYASVSGAHSAELLPNDRAIVAGAAGLIGGHELVLFDLLHSERRLWETDLNSGHGVYWDRIHQVLWALGGGELREYELINWESESPGLKLKRSYPLPIYGGHDLSPTPDRSALFVTVNADVFLFDLQTHKFTGETRMSKLTDVKSISVHPVTKRVVYIQAERGEWWSPNLRFLEPKQTILLEGERLYKARWVY